jgi:membrane protease YdiL (CAAX protease family)
MSVTFFRNDREPLRGVFLVSLLQVLLVVDVIYLISKLTYFNFPFQIFEEIKFQFLAGIVVLILFFINKYYFESRNDRLINEWLSLNSSVKVRRVFIVLGVIAIVVSATMIV